MAGNPNIMSFVPMIKMAMEKLNTELAENGELVAKEDKEIMQAAVAKLQ